MTTSMTVRAKADNGDVMPRTAALGVTPAALCPLGVLCCVAAGLLGFLAGCGGGDDGAAALPRAFEIAAAGDIGECFGLPASQSAASRTAALVSGNDALVLTPGDHAYEDGTPAEFANCFDPTWGAFKDRIRPAPGNHDYNTPKGEGYFSYFGAQAGPGRRGYYSFDYGGWHFISLDSVVEDTSAASEQYRWLVADLASSRDTLCTIAFWHHPLFNSGERYGPDPKMKPFFEALYNGGVEMVLSGHDHVYERFAPQTANGAADPARGVRQFVIGTGGHSLYKFGPPAPNSEVRVEGVWGILRLTLGEGSYSWQFVPVGGAAAIDSGRDVCHR